MSGYDTTFASFAEVELDHTTPKEREELFAQLDIAQRCRYILDFLRDRGVAVTPDPSGLLIIDKWLEKTPVPRLEPRNRDPLHRRTLPPEWAAFAVDLGLLCGEVSAAEQPTRLWVLYSPSPADVLATPAMVNIPGMILGNVALEFPRRAQLLLVDMARHRLGVDVGEASPPVELLLGELPHALKLRSVKREAGLVRLSAEEARERHARHQTGGAPTGGIEVLRPDQVARYLEHADPSGQITSSSQFTVVDASSLAEARAIVDADEDDGQEPSERLRAFAEQFMDIWPNVSGHPQVSSPYEDGLLEIADSTTLASEFYGSESLVEAMIADLERLTSEHGLYLHWGTTDEIVAPQDA